METGQTLTV